MIKMFLDDDTLPIKLHIYAYAFSKNSKKLLTEYGRLKDAKRLSIYIFESSDGVCMLQAG